MASKKTSLEPPSDAGSGESRYFTKLWVAGKGDEGFQVRAGNIDTYDQEIRYKIKAALKSLSLRLLHVLVQFWSTLLAGKEHQLITKDQPFGFGVSDDERLVSYRTKSECKIYDLSKNYDEESPLVRVFRKRLPEWCLNVKNYLPTQFPQQECANHCNLHGFLALPVFDPTTTLCVGVIELLMSSKFAIPSLHYEVQQIQNALKEQGLTCLQVCCAPAANINHEPRQNDLDKILHLLKVVCDTHQSPLAQTWALSPSASVAAHKQALVISCNRYDSRCLGKFCMSTDALPFYVQDRGLWAFRDACKAKHLEMSRGLVGKALSSRGSCFCEDVTKLSEEEYPLVNNASMYGLTSCLAIYLLSDETNNEYVLELFLPLGSEDGRHMLKQQVIKIASGFGLNDKSPKQVIGPLTKEPYTMQISSVNVSDEWSSTNTNATFTDPGETNSYMKKGKKRKRDSKVSDSNLQGGNQKLPISYFTGTVKAEKTRKRSTVAAEKQSGKKFQTSSVIEGPGTKEPYTMQTSSVNVSDEWSSTNSNATFTDASETNSYMKQGRNRKIGSDDTLVLVIVTYEKDTKWFGFPISLEELRLKRLEREVLLKLKNKVAKSFKLMRKVNCLKLKYKDEDGDSILIGVDKDLELAMIASRIENCLNLICMTSAD